MSDELITLTTLNSTYDADILKIELDKNDIQSFIIDEHTSVAAPHLINALGGIRVQVYQKDAEKAISVLEKINGQAFQ
jgi:hypothetical protein